MFSSLFVSLRNAVSCEDTIAILKHYIWCVSFGVLCFFTGTAAFRIAVLTHNRFIGAFREGK